MRAFSLLGIICFLFSATPANACSCIPYENIEEHIAANDVIFIGVAKESVTPFRLDISPGPVGPQEGMPFHPVVTEFSVRTFLKGGEVTLLKIHHRNSEIANCGVSFVEGNEYLVFASVDDAGVMLSSLCHGTVSSDRETPYGWRRSDYAAAIKKTD